MDFLYAIEGQSEFSRRLELGETFGTVFSTWSRDRFEYYKNIL
ncbi:hypothetical protein LEP1GSC016_2735 [Leptospira borgpetersenii serovar Hardjo-bovis str. Sponselee]|uniref:Uncharacterized protein n=6 Tax=Leptospira borgpetersenii TaxID=174 RepID=M3H3X6_LEPBO|nr:hypothetical protein [Leptospira borgpetersenii]EKP14955.1 hypothetical protein LEP1GSC128_2373 [Leptospira borgpetersenii str. 200801926]EKQ90341.1 hypothetical protein LEP1GSC101_2168 [Leptospira borgpetersenii str. UI 09149]EMG01804.1 hypothetical protein LEP1GSC123_0188 [Leptospira borgpetersenii str. 200701203]EMJ79914.1 hypothetical protein LEP1GSC016_2735 [Leptospira borgpetersenii serovar Hardjo-bovis str. Sponselee]EMK12097.1 hypothetical protein LEP1GSC066_2970 [Leptospira sp. ser